MVVEIHVSLKFKTQRRNWNSTCRI